MPCPKCGSDNVRVWLTPQYAGPTKCFDCGWDVWSHYGVTTWEELADIISNNGQEEGQ